MLRAHEGLRKGILSSYGSDRWDMMTRQLRMIEHCEIVEELGAPLNVGPGRVFDLIEIELGDMPYRLTLDQASWLMRDGALTFSLWEEIDRLFSLSFTFGRDRGRLIAFVGGIQGRHGEASLERYRRLTKAAHGMRPRDLLFEAFRMVCGAIGVAEIRAVSNAARHRPWKVRRNLAVDPTTLDYDALWHDRGGVARDDGFYSLEPQFRMRDEQDVPARKRSLYRQRRHMLIGLAALVTAAVGSSLVFPASSDLVERDESAEEVASFVHA